MVRDVWDVVKTCEGALPPSVIHLLSGVICETLTTPTTVGRDMLDAGLYILGSIIEKLIIGRITLVENYCDHREYLAFLIVSNTLKSEAESEAKSAAEREAERERADRHDTLTALLDPIPTYHLSPSSPSSPSLAPH